MTLVHADHDQGDSEEEILERQLAYKCDQELHVKGLSTGYCKEVHGQVSERTLIHGSLVACIANFGFF